MRKNVNFYLQEIKFDAKFPLCSLELKVPLREEEEEKKGTQSRSLCLSFFNWGLHTKIMIADSV